MKNVLLSTVLIIVPVAVFAVGYTALSPAPTAAAQATAAHLGDMTQFQAILTDVQSIAATGDLAAAQTRITDLETAWDDAQGRLRHNNISAWGQVDGAIDDALSALRAKPPEAGQVNATLVRLQTALADPTADRDAAGVARTVSGVATTDADGRALPCEVMLEQFRTTLAGATVAEANRATVDTFQAKGTERCNADDDTRADDFFAQGIALMTN